MDVHQHEVHVGRNFGELGVGFFKGIVIGSQENTALHVQDGKFHAILGGAHVQAGAWIGFGKIGGSQQARLVRDKIENFFAVPTVIAAGEHVDAVLQQFLRNTRGDAESRGGVFAVGNDQVDVLVLDEVGEPVTNNLAAGRPHDVADEENAHETL